MPNLKWFFRIPAFALVFLISGCAASSKLSGAKENPVRSAIIFVPGYYGSALKEKESGDRFFITAGNYLFGSQSVSLHNQDLLTPQAPELELDGVLDGVRLIPGLYTVDVYGKFLNGLRKYAIDTNQELVPFAYDWRQDLSETARRLSQAITGLQSRGITRIQIVAHSMGCLITTYYLAYGDQVPEGALLNWTGAKHVSRAVLMAGPYRGAFTLFRNMQTGAKIGSNNTFMPAETVASLPASYQLLPFPDFHLLDMNGKNLEFKVNDVSLWKKYQLGLFRDQSLAAEVQQKRFAYVSAQLRRAQVFSNALALPADPNHAPPTSLQVLQLVGTGHLVVDTSYWDQSKDGFFFDTDNLEKLKLAERPLFMDGDGSVTVRSSKLPPALEPNARVMHSTVIHEKIFEDEAFAQALLEFLK